MKKFMNKLKGDKHDDEHEVDQSHSSSTTQQQYDSSSTGGTHPASHSQQQQQQQYQQQQPVGGAMGTSTGASTGRDANIGDRANGVILHTTLGKITIALYSDKTPRVSFLEASPFLLVYLSYHFPSNEYVFFLIKNGFAMLRNSKKIIPFFSPYLLA